ncbi:MAG: protein translocase SEC61 complex subunit gamma [Candidatus Aenigmatarchaeota archaeon]
MMGIKSLFSPAAWKERLTQYKRTVEVSRKPDRMEFNSSAKITGIGIALIGAIGFAIFLAYHFIMLVVK